MTAMNDVDSESQRPTSIRRNRIGTFQPKRCVVSWSLRLTPAVGPALLADEPSTGT